jgi:hypothetical protein
VVAVPDYGHGDRMIPSLLEFVILALATYRICRLLIEDRILDAPRNWFFSKVSPSTQFGYLLTCYHCLSMYVGTFVFICYTIVPTVTIPVACVLALSAVTGYISTKLDN